MGNTKLIYFDVDETDAPQAWPTTDGKPAPVLSVPVRDRVVILRFTSVKARQAFVEAAARAERDARDQFVTEARKSWRPLVHNDYKTKWCTPCTGGSDKAGVWAHWERSDGFTVCGEFHKPEDYPL